jgi:hypothetical protein
MLALFFTLLISQTTLADGTDYLSEVQSQPILSNLSVSETAEIAIRIYELGYDSFMADRSGEILEISINNAKSTFTVVLALSASTEGKDDPLTVECEIPKVNTVKDVLDTYGFQPFVESRLLHCLINN